MAITKDLLGFVSVGTLLGPDSPELRIPDFQRPYSWTPRIASQLLTDIHDALSSRPGSPYIIGTVILLARAQETHLEVVDGQQRLLTLHLIRSLLCGERNPNLTSGETPVHLVYQELARRVDELSRFGEDAVAGFREFLDEQVQILRIVTDDEDEAFQFFDSQNFRGKSLRPHDLLKAFHLREMVGASGSEQRAVVDEWESAEENELDRLFGTYLSRIHWWSRNESARAFTVGDLDLFKGVSRSTRRLPGAEYHRAAKAILPGLQELFDPTEDADLRDHKRAQHQLDTPVVAGKSFFDYAAFMLGEITRLEEELFTSKDDADGSDWTDFRDGARFRFCRELYVAAALYYTNKYSDTDLPAVRHRLFRWAYALRLGYERLGWRSVDNYARGERTLLGGLNELNLFARIRDSLDPREIPLENLRAPDSSATRNEDDKRLARLLNGAQS